MLDEKFKSYLRLLGLEEFFTEDQLRSSYATMAKLNHPDINKNPTSEMKMISLNEAYNFLKAYTNKTRPESSLHETNDPCYENYKKAFQIMKEAFEEYFGEKEEKYNTGNATKLQERLKESKKIFANIVNKLPYNDWTDDAIEKIYTINRWLD